MNDLKIDVNQILLKVNSDNNGIRYCVYRTAFKLCQLQEVFHLTEIPSSSVKNAIRGLMQNEECLQGDETLTLKSLNLLIHNLLTTILQVPEELETKLLSKRLALLLFSMFKNRQDNKVALITIVMFFITMGSDDLQVKYRRLFELYSGSLGMLTRSRVGLLLAHLLRIADVVGEGANFGKINCSVLSCFEGVIGNMISVEHFLQWTFREPQSIVWLPTMHRLNASRSSVHDVECSSCKLRPIVGLRFQCLKCLDYNSCQICFLNQQDISRSHKLNHPRQEYCVPAGGKEKLNAFARTIRNIVTKRYKHKSPAPSYLPVGDGDDGAVDTQFQSLFNQKLFGGNDSNADFGDLSHLAEEERKDLERLTKKLKKERKKVTGTVHMLETSRNETNGFDHDSALLQSKLDTMALHNHSLQAELDNLKCVVFAENFTQGSAQRVVVEESSLENDLLEQPFPGSVTSEVKHNNQQGRVESDCFSVDSDSSSMLENQLRKILTDLTTNLSKSISTSTGSSFKDICNSSKELNDAIDILIEHALKI